MLGEVDKIFFINLDYRTDRRDLFMEEMNKMSIPREKIERFPAYYLQDGALACMLSHLKVLQIAKERGYSNVLIFEDDFEFLVDQKTFHSSLENFFSLNLRSWDVLFLSYKVNKSEPYNSLISYARESQTASGYLVNSSFFDTLISNFTINARLLKETGAHWLYCNDQCWKSLQSQGNWFYFNTRLGKQRSGYSDLGRSFVSYDC